MRSARAALRAAWWCGTAPGVEHGVDEFEDRALIEHRHRPSWWHGATTALLRRFGYILVTSVDSSRDLSQLHKAQAIVQRQVGAQFLGHGLLVPSSRVSEATGGFGRFTGFDEVWCFHEAPSLIKPDDVSLVAPLNVATDKIPARVVQ